MGGVFEVDDAIPVKVRMHDGSFWSGHELRRKQGRRSELALVSYVYGGTAWVKASRVVLADGEAEGSSGGLLGEGGAGDAS